MEGNIKFPYDVEPMRTPYYDVDGKVTTVDEMRKLKLGPDDFEHGTTTYGREAVEKYGD
jgi:hypothetical protein